MSSLSFDFSEDFRPLPARMRPRTLAEYIGQSHLIGEGNLSVVPLKQGILIP
ncbi:recombination factor protein RarA [Actinobacillus equuli]|nr:recombination factor protein RarA [Actinobacillus equuli]